MYGVNTSIPKTLIKYLVKFVAQTVDEQSAATLYDIIATPISPELIPADDNGNIQQKTEDLVGPYELHDFFLYHFLRHGFSPRKILMLAKKAFGGNNSEYPDAGIMPTTSSCTGCKPSAAGSSTSSSSAPACPMVLRSVLSVSLPVATGACLQMQYRLCGSMRWRNSRVHSNSPFIVSSLYTLLITHYSLYITHYTLYTIMIIDFEKIPEAHIDGFKGGKEGSTHAISLTTM